MCWPSASTAVSSCDVILKLDRSPLKCCQQYSDTEDKISIAACDQNQFSHNLLSSYSWYGLIKVGLLYTGESQWKGFLSYTNCRFLPNKGDGYGLVRLHSD